MDSMSLSYPSMTRWIPQLSFSFSPDSFNFISILMEGHSVLCLNSKHQKGRRPRLLISQLSKMVGCQTSFCLLLLIFQLSHNWLHDFHSCIYLWRLDQPSFLILSYIVFLKIQYAFVVSATYRLCQLDFKVV